MSTKNTPSLPQFPRNYGVNVTTASGGSLTAPTNTGLVWAAGPDGSDIYQLGAIATATQTSANTIELFTSVDFGSTFSALPMTGSFAASAATGTTANIGMPNAVPMGPTNALLLAGATGVFTHQLARSGQTEAQNWYAGAVPSGGTANAQTVAAAFNSAGTQLGATPANGSILDIVAGITNTGAMTIQPGAAGSAVTVKRPDGTDPAAGDVTKNFRYRFVYSTALSEWILLPTQRLYAAITQSQALTVTAWGADR